VVHLDRKSPTTTEKQITIVFVNCNYIHITYHSSWIMQISG